jgi:hypothetical protein
MTDAVNRPSHYTEDRTVEVIDYIREQTGDGFVDYCVGNALKYLSRAGLKGDTAQDYAKAAWYCRMAAHVTAPGRFPDPRT